MFIQHASYGIRDYISPLNFFSQGYEFTGNQIFDQLLTWRETDVVLASRLEAFFNQIELDAEALRAGEPMPLPTLRGEKNPNYSDLAVYEVESGASTYWAHELLVKRGESQFKVMKAEVVSMTVVDDN